MNQNAEEERSLQAQIKQLDNELRRVQARLDLLTSIMGVAVFRALLYHKVIGFARNIQNVVQELKHDSSVDARDEALRGYLEVMDGSAGELLESLRDIRIVSASDGIEVFCINKLIHELFDKEFFIYAQEEFQLRLPSASAPRMSVCVNPWWIKQVFRVIAENAVNAMRNSQTKLLTITTLATDDGYIKINLKDTGPGIPPDILGQLFKGLIMSGRGRGKGLGAVLAAIIVESYDGVIEIEETSDNGANITILLPHIVS
jgi:signal transduction histidine kinase